MALLQHTVDTQKNSPPPPSKTHFNTSKRHRSVSSSLLYSQHLFQCLMHVGVQWNLTNKSIGRLSFPLHFLFFLLSSKSTFTLLLQKIEYIIGMLIRHTPLTHWDLSLFAQDTEQLSLLIFFNKVSYFLAEYTSWISEGRWGGKKKDRHGVYCPGSLLWFVCECL